MRMPAERIEELVESHRAWIESHLARIPQQDNEDKLSPEELVELVEKANVVFPQRVAYYATQMGVTYGRITIRKQRTKWGSCSSKGNLNFNALLMLAPPPVQDYIVVHELAHRKHLNHSTQFWTEVEKMLPDYRRQEAWLKTNGNLLMGKLFD